MNSFGSRFRVSLFGTSHGPVVGVVIDGVPAGMPLDVSDFAVDLGRRRGGARGTTARVEEDDMRFASGVHGGYTTGGPLCIEVVNAAQRGGDYRDFATWPRPGHADYPAGVKWGGYADLRGGGMFSGRMTVGLVCAGVVAKRLLDCVWDGVRIAAGVVEVGGQRDYFELLDEVLRSGDSLGGVVACRIEGLGVGVGAPFFGSLESRLASMLFSIPGVKGVEFGAGFRGAAMLGSDFNDRLLDASGAMSSNNSGGINGGLSNGMPVDLRVAFRPTASIARSQSSFDFSLGRPDTVRVGGRHDACFALRTPVVVEAACALVLADFAPSLDCIRSV
ncbi:MAG: chorismate synthase [Bacteroidetes bacterium]|nr:MAG: chorismate synthase [Bacteroidota bacterium]